MEIQLTQGKVALVDDEDYEMLMQWKWCAHVEKHRIYAVRRIGEKMLKMHRVIMGVTDPNIKVDHKEGYGLDNQRSNLRVATNAQNIANQRPRLNVTSKYKGVHWDKFTGKWRVQVQNKDGVKRIGRFENEIEAALAYNKAAIELQGEFARLNVF